MLRGVPLWILLSCACSSTPMPVSSIRAPNPTASARAIDPPKPGLRLPRNFLPTAYRVHLAIDPASARFHGSVEIDGDIRERSRGIWLHGRGLHVTAARVTGGGRSLRVDVVQPGDDLLSLHPAEALDAGHYTLAIDYDAAFDTDGLGVYKRTVEDNVYVATQFEPFRARRAFPCLDEPDNKVSWQLTLDVPRALLAFSNTPVLAETALDAATRRVAFAPTRPLPSYLVAFAVGPYDVVDLGKTPSGTPMRIITLKGRANQARFAAETTPRILALLEDYFGAYASRSRRRGHLSGIRRDHLRQGPERPGDVRARDRTGAVPRRRARLCRGAPVWQCDLLITRGLERLDSCVALRRLLAPRYAAWLARTRASQ